MVQVQIYSRPHCIYCTKSKAFMKEKNIPFEEIFIDPLEDDDYAVKRDDLYVRSNGQKTFPFIFVGTEFLGGYTELVQAHSSLRLQELLNQSGFQVEETEDF